MSTAKKPASKEAIQEKKKSIRIAVIVILIVGLVVAGILFAQNYFAPETVLHEVNVQTGGKSLTVVLSEKSSAYDEKQPDGIRESGIRHYGYFLELKDSASHASLMKLKFKSPVMAIQNTPELFCFPNGDVWVVSTSNLNDDDERGFILKFLISGNQISQTDFSLDEKYYIRDLKDQKVILSDGQTHYSGYSEIFGGIYLDLSTGKIVDDRKQPE